MPPQSTYGVWHNHWISSWLTAGLDSLEKAYGKGDKVHLTGTA